MINAQTYLAWGMTLRFKTLSVSLCPFLVVLALGHLEGILNVRTTCLWGLLLIISALVQILTNVINDYYDVTRGTDTLERLGPKRGLHRGILQLHDMRRGIVFIAGLTLVLGGVASLVHGSLWVMLLLIPCLFLSYAYTGGRYALAYIGAAEPFAFAFFGPLATGLSAWLMGAEMQALYWVIGVPLGCFASAMLQINNLRDRLQDARTGKKTFAVRYGETAARLQYAWTVIGGLLVMPVWVLFSGKFLWALPSLIVMPEVFFHVITVFTKSTARLNVILIRTSLGLMGYTLLLLSVILLRGV